MDYQASISRDDLECMLLEESTDPIALPLSLLQGITFGFSDEQEIGRGGFAVVYKGILGNGLAVAVKRLFHTYRHEKEFQREVECLMKVKHNNIVRFMGYCVDTQGSAANFEGKIVIAEVQQRLLCFEYLPNGSLDKHIQDASDGLEWSKRYKIIIGICEGLSYLHQKNIVHLDLKPPNILMDANMMPKITDFGLSRCFEEKQSRVITTHIGGTLGYLAPEYANSVITHKFDLYSLGTIIMEMLTGSKGYQAVETVLESWTNRVDKSEAHAHFEQIRVCAEIAIECINYDPEKRPASIQHIITRLEETRRAQVILGSNELLDVDPLVLRFPFEPNKIIPCSLQLTNNTDKHTPFRLMNTNVNKCLANLPLYGVVPPRSTYTLVVTMEKQDKLPEKKYFDLILKSSPVENDHNWLSPRYQHDDFFDEDEDEEMGNVVHEVTLKALCTPRRGTIVSKVSHAAIPCENVYSFDTHPTKQWIITGHKKGRVHIWNYETQRLMGSCKVSGKTVTSIKFVELKKWFVAGTEDGFVHVYTYDLKLQRITCYRAHGDPKVPDKRKRKHVMSLVVHPILPYILSLADNCDQAKLWNWNKGWECTQTYFMGHSRPNLAFNPMDTNIFASASENHTIKIWSLDCSESKFALSGHSGDVNCLDFFTRDDQHYLITGSEDCTAKIWDMQKGTCVHTLEAFKSSIISVFSPPSLPILITGSTDGVIHLWSSSNFRVERVIQVGYGKALCFMGPGRFVIGKYRDISVMSLHNVSEQVKSTDTIEQLLNVDREPTTITQATPACSGLVLGVRRTSRSLELTNDTDERVAYRVRGTMGIVPPKGTYTLVSAEEGDKIILQTRHLLPFETKYDREEFFDEAQDMGIAMHELTLDTFDPKAEGTSSEAIPPITKIIHNVAHVVRQGDEVHRLCSLDVHPTAPLILAGRYKDSRSQVLLWSYDPPPSQEHYLDTVTGSTARTLKFIPQKQWFAAGTTDGFIHVYEYDENEIRKITRLDAGNDTIRSLSVHPTESYLISQSGGLIKRWDWDWNNGWPDYVNKFMGWKCDPWHCTQTFENGYSPVAFNRKETNIVAGASNNHTVKVWDLNSPGSEYTLSGHSGDVKCLDFFTRGDHHYLITGSDDCTAKIWDLQDKKCVHTLNGFLSRVISVISLPDRPYIISASKDGIVYIWSSTDFRLERTVTFGYARKSRFTNPYPYLGLTGMRRIVIVQEGNLSLIDFDDEEEMQ